jgi:hypothetical protein
VADDRQPDRPEQVGDEVGHLGLGVDHGEVGVARRRARLGPGLDVEHDLGPCGAELAQDRHGEVVGEGGRELDPEHPPQPALLAHDLVQHLLQPVVGLGDRGEECLTGVGEGEGVGPALEELDAQEPLQLDDVAAHRTLGDEEAVGGGGEAQVPAHGLEGAERVEGEPAAVEGHRDLEPSPGLPGRRRPATLDPPHGAGGDRLSFVIPA